MIKIFSWMRNKSNGKEGSNKPNQEPVSHHIKHREEFSDWPNGLLAIGTFGNKHSEKLSNIPSSQEHHHPENTAEDNEELDKELRILLNKHIFSGEHENKQSLLLEKLLDWLRKKTIIELSENKELSHLQRTFSVVQKEGKEIRLDHNINDKKVGIGKKSLSFLLKKAFACRGGFVPAPILRELADPKSDQSRMEKILRALLHKKIYPRRPSPKNSPKKYLDVAVIDNDEEEYGEDVHESKWVKTDSDFIVLEI